MCCWIILFLLFCNNNGSGCNNNCGCTVGNGCIQPRCDESNNRNDDRNCGCDRDNSRGCEHDRDCDWHHDHDWERDRNRDCDWNRERNRDCDCDQTPSWNRNSGLGRETCGCEEK
ncbi:MAG: hypothetical protein IJ405_07035 [Lachnospiraceae bacterium]|nr:hypothetical protein [Lachnospiraceae bacterium]MBQ7781758.1 hypothetical protein [Lachnospiraceae bacterium]